MMMRLSQLPRFPLGIAFACLAAGLAVAQQATPPAGAKSAADDVVARGQRDARNIKFGDWQKVCFKPGGAKMICRTTINGAFDTGQSALRIYLTEREGDSAARLQLFLPVGLNVQAGAKLTVDKGSAYKIPFKFCLTNTCIAGDLAAPALLRAMEAGKSLTVEVVDTNMLAVTASLPLAQFAAVRKGAPAQVFEQQIDE
jgi:invasion protein IalB